MQADPVSGRECIDSWRIRRYSVGLGYCPATFTANTRRSASSGGRPSGTYTRSTSSHAFPVVFRPHDRESHLIIGLFLWHHFDHVPLADIAAGDHKPVPTAWRQRDLLAQLFNAQRTWSVVAQPGILAGCLVRELHSDHLDPVTRELRLDAGVLNVSTATGLVCIIRGDIQHAPAALSVVEHPPAGPFAWRQLRMVLVGHLPALGGDQIHTHRQ